MNEIQTAKSDDEWIEKLADLDEVLISLVTTKGYSEEKFLSIVNNKNERRGGFSDKLFLKNSK